MIPGWLEDIEEEVVSCLCNRGRMSPRELAGALGVSEASAVHYVYLLASRGRLTIEGVAVAAGQRSRQGRNEGEDPGTLVGGSVG